MIPLSKIVLDDDAIEAVVAVLKSGKLTQGKKVAELEKKIAKLCGVKYAVAVNSGTAAIHCILYALGIEKGDEVITTPLSFVATANPILMVGAKPVFVDIDEKNYNIDPDKIESAITKKTKAIIAVNLYGQPANYEQIIKIAKKHKLFVIEDAAQSINAKYKNKTSGNLADIGCFSLYATKNIISGEGGLITTNNKTYYEKAVRFRQHGENPGKRYDYIDLGYNYRMTDILASIAIVQLKKVHSYTKTRQKIAKLYSSAFKMIKELVVPSVNQDRTHVYHQYVLRIKKNAMLTRDAMRKFLAKKGVETNVHYPKPLYEFPHLTSYKLSNSSFPITKKVVNEILSIPVHPHLTIREIEYIIDTITSCFQKKKVATIN